MLHGVINQQNVRLNSLNLESRHYRFFINLNYRFLSTPEFSSFFTLMRFSYTIVFCRQDHKYRFVAYTATDSTRSEVFTRLKCAL